LPPAAHLPRQFRFFFAAALIAAAFMPFVPDQVTLQTVSFVLFFMAWCVVALPVRLRASRPPRQHAWIGLLLFYCSVAVSLPIAFGHGAPFAEWVRAAVPFVFLATYFLFPTLAADDRAFILRSTMVAVICWLIKALAGSLAEFLRGGAERLTYLSKDFQLPFTLVGLALVLFWGGRRRPLESLVVGLVLALVVVGTGYRSQALLMATLWIVYLARQTPRRRFLLAGSTFISCAIAFVWFATSSFGQAYLSRYQGLQGELQSQRGAEALYGLKKFSEAPVLGKGLGFPVPLAVNQFGVEDPPPSDEADHVGYIHDVWIYLCMDLGVLGLVGYVAFFGTAVVSALRRGGWNDDGLLAAAVTVVTLLAYFTVEAAFREIQMNFLLGAFCAVLAKAESDAPASVGKAPA